MEEDRSREVRARMAPGWERSLTLRRNLGRGKVGGLGRGFCLSPEMEGGMAEVVARGEGGTGVVWSMLGIFVLLCKFDRYLKELSVCDNYIQVWCGVMAVQLLWLTGMQWRGKQSLPRRQARKGQRPIDISGADK